MASLAPWLQDPTQMDPTTSLGLQLLANSNTPGGFGSIFGRSALAAGQDYQAAQLNQQKIQQGLLAQQTGQQQLAFMNQFMNGGQPGAGQQAPQGAPPQASIGGTPQTSPPGQQAGFMPGVSQMPQQQPQAFGFTQPPQSAQPQQQSPQGPGFFAAPTQQDINSIPIDGKDPRMLVGYQTFIEKKPLLEALQNVHKQQLEQASEQFSGKLTSLEYLARNDTPTKWIKNDPQLMAAWPQLAAQVGLDPEKDFNDDNVRHAATYAYNQIATPLGKAQLPQSNKLITRGNQQLDPVTGKVEHEEGLEDVDLGNGQHALMPQSQAIGKPKYNASAATAGSITDQAKELAYQRFKATGEMPAAGKGGAASQTAYANFFAKRAAEDGDDGAALAARSQQYKASQGVVKDFTSGKTSQTLNGLNTAVGHMDQLDQAATALSNGNVQALNKASNFFGTQFGGSATTNFNVIKNFAAGEVAKAVLPGGGGEHEREEIADAIKSSNSPQQLHDAISTWRNLLSSKTEALRNQWEIGTNGTQGSFDKFLLPPTKKALGINSAPTQAPGTNSKGWALHTDKNGNQAYVSPDGKSYEEVK